jgi:hypothetical protein
LVGCIGQFNDIHSDKIVENAVLGKEGPD